MRLLTLLLLASLFIPGASLAADEPDEPGKAAEEEFTASKYGGLGLALGLQQFDFVGTANFDEGIGADVVIGYRGHPNVAMEAQFVYMQGIDIESGVFDVEYEIFTANMKYFPFDGQFEPYVLAGLGGGRVGIKSGAGKNDDSGAVFRFGVGTEVNLSESLALVLGTQYLFTFGAIEGFDTLELKFGVVSRFW